MTKKLIAGVMGLFLFAFQAVPAFAAETVTADTAEKIIAGGGMATDEMIPYYGNGVSFSVSVRTYAAPETITVYGDYYYSTYNDSEINTRAKLLAHLNDVYDSAESKLAGLGELTQTGLNVYSSYTMESDKQWDGYLNIRLDLDDVDNYVSAKAVFVELGFNQWADMIVSEDDKIDAEAASALRLKNLIDKKKTVYEQILGYALSKIISLNVYSWPDSYLFNSKTGLVPLTITADVTYSTEE